jgi:hypothetical protein
MSTPNEQLWQQEADTRKRIRKWLLKTGVGLLCLLLAAWAIITQPLFSHSPVRNDIPPVDSSKLETHVRTISEKMFPRDPGHQENLDRVAEYIRHAFASANGIVSDQPFDVKGKTYRNIIADFGPETREMIIVGAHYDAVEDTPGSDDNAGGIAGLLELAGLLGKTKPARRVELVAYTLEEPPYFGTKFMGSAVHAESLKRQNKSVHLMISLEMIGCFSDVPGSQEMPSSLIKPFYPNRGDFIAVVGKIGHGGIVRRVKRAMRSASNLPVYSLNAPRFLPGIDFSDHVNYWDAGYKALMITDTAFYRNARYHTIKDTPDTLDYRRMTRVIQGVYAAILDFAQE